MAKGRLEGVVQARGRDRRDSGAVALAVIAPSGRARLRVQVDKRRPETIRLRGHGEVDSERGLPRAALLRDQGHCIHIDYPMCRALTCRALEGSIPIGAGRKPRVLFSGGRSAVAWENGLDRLAGIQAVVLGPRHRLPGPESALPSHHATARPWLPAQAGRSAQPPSPASTRQTAAARRLLLASRSRCTTTSIAVGMAAQAASHEKPSAKLHVAS